MKKITLNTNGTLKHVWIEGVHSDIPDDAISVSDMDFVTLANNRTSKRWDAATQKVVNYTLPFDVNHAKAVKKEQIKQAFETAELLPVYAMGHYWNGGYTSAQKLDGAKRLAERAGLTLVRLFDLDNLGHDLNFSDAEVVVLAVAADYQAKFAQYQALKVAIDNLPNNAVAADFDAIDITF